MDADKIKKLLSRKRLSGAEVGLLRLASYAYQKKAMGKKLKPFFKEGQLEAYQAQIISEQDVNDYLFFDTLLNSLVFSFNNSLALQNRFFNGYYNTALEIREISNAVNVLFMAQFQPLALEQAELDKAKADALERYRGTERSFYEVFFHILAYCLKTKDGSLEASNILASYADMPANDSKWLSLYGEAFCPDYLELPDGTKSIAGTAEDWDKAWQAFLIEQGLTQAQIEEVKGKRFEFFYKGADFTRAYLEKLTGHKPALKKEALTRAIDAEQGAQGDISEALLSCYGITRKHDNPTAETLTLFDQARLYAWLSFGGKGEERRVLLRKMESEMPALYGAIVAYMEALIPEARNLKKKDYLKPIVTQGALIDAGEASYKKGVEGYTSDLRNLYPEDTTADCLKRRQIENRGIAVICDPAQPDKIKAMDIWTLVNSFAGTDKITQQRVFNIHNAQRVNVIGSYKSQLAYNALFAILERVYGVPELGTLFKYDTSKMEEKMRAFNTVLYKLNAFIFGTGKDRKEQRARMKEAFIPFDIEAYQVDPKAIEEVEKEMRESGFTQEAKGKVTYFETYYLLKLGYLEGF